MEKCKQTEKHRCTFKSSICSSQCKYWMKRHRFYRLECFAQHTDEWKKGDTPRLTRNGNIISCSLGNFVPLVVPGFLVVPGLTSSSSSSSASTSRTQGQSSSSGESEKSSDPVTTRSDMPACGRTMQTDLEKPVSGNCGSANKDELDKEDPKQGIPDRLQSFSESRGSGDACARTFL